MSNQMNDAIVIAVGLSFNSIAVAQGTNTDWASFRGRQANGTATNFKTATSWDVTDADDKSILWKSPIPGLGHSCPTIVGERIIVTTAVPSVGESKIQIGRGGDTDPAEETSDQSWMIMCFDKSTGGELWRRTAHVGIPKVTRHSKASHANTTVAVDGDNGSRLLRLR